MKMPLEEALDYVQVDSKFPHDPDLVSWWPDSMPWGVSTEDAGIVAIFQTEDMANHYRMTLVLALTNSNPLNVVAV